MTWGGDSDDGERRRGLAVRAMGILLSKIFGKLVGSKEVASLSHSLSFALHASCWFCPPPGSHATPGGSHKQHQVTFKPAACCV